jgi:hypothetical protein
MACVHIVRRVQPPSRTARDKRPVIISIKHAAKFVFKKTIGKNSNGVRLRTENADLGDTKQAYMGSQVLQKQKIREGENWTLYKELVDDEIKFYQFYLECPSTNSIIRFRRLKKI